jgi:hypothetical protein
VNLLWNRNAEAVSFGGTCVMVIGVRAGPFPMRLSYTPQDEKPPPHSRSACSGSASHSSLQLFSNPRQD